MAILWNRVPTVLLLVFLGLPCSVHAASVDSTSFKENATLLRSIHQHLMGPSPSSLQLKQWSISARHVVRQSTACVHEEAGVLGSLNRSLHMLGQPVPGEPGSLTALRNSLASQKKAADARSATCRVLLASGTRLLSALQRQEAALDTRQLFQKNAGILRQLQNLADLPQAFWGQENRLWLTVQGAPLPQNPIFLLALALGAATFAGVRFLRPAKQPASRTLSHLSAFLVTTLVVWAGGAWSPLVTLLLAIWMVNAVLALGFGKLLQRMENPGGPEREQLQRIRASRNPFRLLASAVLSLQLYQWLDPRGTVVLLQGTALSLFIHLALVPVVPWLVWRMAGAGSLPRRRILELPVAVWAVAVPCLDLAGFGNLADYLFTGGTVTLLALLAALFSTWMIQSSGHGDTARKPVLLDSVLQGFGLAGMEVAPWLHWIRILAHVLVWLAALLILLVVWGVPQSFFHLLWKDMARGYTIGGFSIQPVRWIFALALMALLVNLNNWVQKKLSGDSFFLAHMDTGSRHSLLAILRYLGFAIAFIVALSTAGVALQNLAIVAGALSVGIGFGLQNIVNNFVSGIILLLERPIRVGDWIQVGTAEGYVQRLGIRYTLIQTFDRTEVFVPNSELISGQVTNWMYSSSILRLMIPFRLAHSADIDTVRNVLEAAGQQHPGVLQDDPRGLPPTALLLDVTENALVFYLRVYIPDCNASYTVQTELRSMAVEALFRKGLRLAHQQQDVHLFGRSTSGAS